MGRFGTEPLKQLKLENSVMDYWVSPNCGPIFNKFNNLWNKEVQV